MNACSVCRSARRPEADAMLAAGATLADVVRATGLDRQALGRHRKNGHVPPPAAPTTPTSARTPGDPLASMRGDLAALNAMDPATMSPSAAMALFAERRRLNVDLARLDPPVVAPPETPTLTRFIEVVLDATRDHPDINARISAAWREYRGLPPSQPRDDADEARYRTDTQEAG